MRRLPYFLALLIGAAIPSFAQADLLGTYEFTDNALSVTDADGADGIAFSDINLNSYTADQAFSAAAATLADPTLDFFSLNGVETPNSTGAAFSGGLYLSFTVTNTSGSTLNFETMNIDYRGTTVFQQQQARLYNTNSPGDILDDTITRIGKPNGGTDDEFVTDINFLDGTAADSGTNFAGVPITLADGNSVTFYLPFNMNSNSNTRVGDYDNLAISGNLATIPEPSTAALLCGMSLVVLRRRR